MIARLAVLAAVLAFAVVAGCASVGPYRAAISSADVNERILGVRAAGQAGDRRAVPLLVDRLEDEDEAVRLFAIIALEKITGERFGYDYGKDSRGRAESVVRWRTYVKSGMHLDSTRSVADEPGLAESVENASAERMQPGV